MYIGLDYIYSVGMLSEAIDIEASIGKNINDLPICLNILRSRNGLRRSIMRSFSMVTSFDNYTND